MPDVNEANAPKPPTELTREELLDVENLSLKAQLVAMKKENFLVGAQQQISAFDAQLSDLQAGIKKAQSRLGEKYGIDFTKQQIEAGTGRIISVG